MRIEAKHPNAALALILALTLIVQIGLLGLSMPITAVLSGAHSFYIDNPYHVYQIELGRELLKHGQLLGYDPLFGGGHLGGMNDNVSTRVPVLLAAMLPSSMPSGAVYSLYVLVCALVAPLAVGWMARLLHWPPAHAAIACAAGLALWWVGALHWYHSAGMVSFVCGSYLGLPYAVWTWQLCKAPTGRKIPALIGAGIAGGLGMWLHPLFPLLVGALFLGLFIWDKREARVPVIIGRGIAIAAIALVVNLPWLIAVLGSRDFGANHVVVHPFQKTVGMMVALMPAMGKWGAESMGTFLNPLMFLTCVAGLVFLPPAQRRRMLPFVFAGVLLLLFAAFGAASVSLGQVQPNRFIASAFLLVGLGAAWVVGEGIAWLRSSARRNWQLGALAVGCALSLVVGREMLREATAGPHGHYGKAPPELTDSPALVAQLQTWISANTVADGRIVFETSLARIHGGGHVAGLVALKTGREFLGAAYPYSLAVVSFWDHIAFGRPIGEVTNTEWARGFDLYNIGWVVAHSPDLKRTLDAMPGVLAAGKVGPLSMYKVDRALSYIHEGSGRVVARSFNRVEVTGASGPQVVLKYHWLPGLVASPAAKTEPAQVAEGFPPFVRVINPPAAFTLSLCRDCKAP